MRVPLLSDQDTLHPIPTTSELEHRRLTVLHIGTLNKPIGTNLGYSPIETVIENVHQGLRACGHRSIVACAARIRGSQESGTSQCPRALATMCVTTRWKEVDPILWTGFRHS